MDSPLWGQGRKYIEMGRDLEQAIPSILIVKQLWLRSTALETEEMAQRVESSCNASMRARV